MIMTKWRQMCKERAAKGGMWPWRQRLASACRPCAHSTLCPNGTAGQAQCTYTRHACAHNMLRPSRAVAQFNELMLAAPALTACCAQAILWPK